MSKINYFVYALEACEKERIRQWAEAEALWLKAHSYTHVGEPNRHWSWARQVYCRARRFSDHVN